MVLINIEQENEFIFNLEKNFKYYLEVKKSFSIKEVLTFQTQNFEY